MTRQEWAVILDSLRDDDDARRDALLMLSDEDWVADEFRPWLCEEARYPDLICPNAAPSRNHYWLRVKNKLRFILDADAHRNVDDRIFDRLKRGKLRIEANERLYNGEPDPSVTAWLDLLEAIS